MIRLIVPLLLLTGCSSVPDRMDIMDYEPRFQEYSAPSKENGSIFSNARSVDPFGEVLARNHGDILTVLLVEEMSASKRSASNSNKSSEATIAPLSLLGNTVTTGRVGGTDLSASLSSDNSFSGAGAASQSNEIEGKITVTVHQVLPNGNLFVKGEKWIRINTGEELVQVSGIVRPYDISSGNVIESTKLADARIIYSGEGHLKEASEPGVLFKVINNSWWPF